jgi:hypothetical protein
MKFLVVLFALTCSMSFGQAYAMQATPSGSPGGSMSYTCSNNAGGTPTCECTGIDDCLQMDDDGVCIGETANGSIVNDVTCEPGFSSCSCTWQSIQSTGPGMHERQSSGTNMAPADETPTIRDRRNRHRTSSVAQPQTNSARRDHRSGDNNAATDDDNEAETQAGAAQRTPRTRRDQRTREDD